MHPALILCLLLLVPGPRICSQQSEVFRTDHISAKEGLSNRWAKCVHQDANGFIWIGTYDGLNRYDGHDFVVYRPSAGGRFPVSADFILKIAETADGSLYISTKFGILHFNPETGVFNLLLEDKGRIGLVLMPGANGAFLPLGLTEWDMAKWGIIYELLPSGDIQALTESFSSPFLNIGSVPAQCDREGLWIWEPQGAYHRFDFKDKKWFRFAVPGSKDVPVDAAGRLWIPDGAGLRSIALPDYTRPNQWIGFNIEQGKAVWLYTQQKGRDFFTLLRYELQNNILQTAIPEIRKGMLNYPLGQPFLPSHCLDEEGTVWMAGFQGLLKVRRIGNSFAHYLSEPIEQVESPPLGMTFREIVKAGAGKIFAHTAYEVYKIDLQTGNTWQVNPFREETFLPINTAAGKLPDLENADYVQSIHTDQRYIYSMGADREGFIWISSLKHLFRYDPATEQFRRYFYPGPGVYIFYADFGAQILLGCIGKGNFFLDKQTGKWQPAPNWNLDLLKPPLIIPEENTLWGITDTGLMKINTQTFDTRYIRLYDDAREQRCIVAHRGWLWIGTARGLEKVNPQTFSHVNFDRSKGLPGNYVYSMVADGNYLWLGTGEGLCRFHVETNEVKNFYVEDGLSHNEFNTLSTLKMDDGRILMGGLNGINAFYPSDLEGKTTATSRTLLSRYSLFDTKADSLFFFIPSKSETSIVLPASVTSLNLYLALSSYLNPAENQYVWRMDGFDDEWYYAGNQHVAMYRHIPPGTYTFRAKAADPFGNWSGNEISLRIIVLRPWYSRWWAWLLYALLTGWAVLSLYRNQLSKKMEHAENLRLQELDGFKNRFFTNITHEFRTPLTVILGLSEYVESKVDSDLKSTVGLIRRNGHNLLRLINQILDLAKLESDTLKINYVQGNVLPYLRYIAESLQSMAQTQNVLLQVESSESEIIMDYDPERLLQIMYNLLSNAIKFTPGGGRVILEIMVEKPDITALDWKAAHKSPHLICKVTDTGVGILPDDLAKVFDRFYQASNLEKAKTGGTGIGLSLTRELVKSMKGDISVQSEVGKGSVFTVRLPILNNSDMQATGNEKIDLPYTYDALKGETTAIASDNGSSAHLSILLIEDNPDVVAYLHTCLGEDYRLEYAYNGRAGIEKALETVPDLIVSDVMMPEKDGFEVCETLKNDERTSHIPIVLLTAKADVESRIAGLRRGADAYLAKPFHREELLVTLKNLIELRQKLQAQYMSDNLSGTPLSAGNRANQTGVDADPENEFLLKLRAIVEAHISDSSLDVDTLCRKIGMGRTNLHNKLSALTGLSTTLYVRKIRLYRSKELLLDTQMNVSEVAYAVGFNDPRFFTRVFSDEFGMPPSALKKG